MKKEWIGSTILLATSIIFVGYQALPENQVIEAAPISTEYEVVKKNVLDPRIREVGRRVPPGEWHTLVYHDNGTTVRDLYIKFRPGKLDQAITLLKFHKAAVQDTMEELPYSFKIDVVEYYIVDGLAGYVGLGSYTNGTRWATIDVLSMDLLPKIGYTGSPKVSNVDIEKGYQIMVTFVWAGVILWSSSEYKVPPETPSWFTQGFRKVIADDFGYGKYIVPKAAKGGAIDQLVDYLSYFPSLSDSLRGMWMVYYLQCRFGKDAPLKILKSGAASFSQAFQKVTGLTVDQFVSDFKTWAKSNLDEYLIEKVIETKGEYMAECKST